MKRQIKVIQSINWDSKKVILLVIITFLIIYTDYLSFLKFQVNAINTLRPKITRLNQDIAGFRRDFANFQKAGSQKPALQINAKKALSDEELPVLLVDISNLANKDNITIMQIRQSKDSKIKDDKPAALSKLSPYFITLDLNAGYHYLVKFLKDLENLDNFISLSEIKITQDTSSLSPQEKIILVLKTYVVK